MGAGGKGGSSTSRVEIPEWLEDPSRRAIARGEAIGNMDYIPHMGPDVAAFSPTQMAAFDNTNAAAGAFGMGQSAGTGLPQAQDFGGGVMGHSSYPVFEQTRSAFEAAYPELAAQRDSFFSTDAMGTPFNPGVVDPATGLTPGGGGPDRSMNSDPGGPPGSNYSGGGFGLGGYSGIGDMMDGGGPGASGSTFSGSPVSGGLNAIGVSPSGGGGGNGSKG